MLYLYASEYMLNSLLYHAYQLDKLTIQIEESSLPEPFQGFVRTSCPDIDQSGDLLKSICVGKLIPAIAKHFPNTTTKFLLLPHEVPEMKFSKGHATISLKGMKLIM
jgi:hypothetical protein